VEALLAEHARRLPAGHPARPGHLSYLDGAGRLHLRTEPPGARATLYRFEEQERRLVEVLERDLGPTPIVDLPLAMGSYLVTLELPGHHRVRYPVFIDRGRVWDTVAPGEDQATPVWIPPLGAIAEGECYVPAGWYLAGGQGPFGMRPPSRHWCHAFVIRRDPVLLPEYLVYLNALLAKGDAEAEAARPPPPKAEDHTPRYFEREGDAFALNEAMDVDPLLPVSQLSYIQVWRYTRWLAREGWRMVSAREWEKAARGVDGRTRPWGSRWEPTWCACQDSSWERKGPRPVGTYPHNVSVYGVRDLLGNNFEWCLDKLSIPNIEPPPRIEVPTVDAAPGADAAYRVLRGGDWWSSRRLMHLAVQMGQVPGVTTGSVRLVRELLGVPGGAPARRADLSEYEVATGG